MKKLYTISILLFLTTFYTNALAQSILVVNDNDNIAYNTDTFRNDLNHTIYSSYSYWSAPDSGTGPSAAYLNNFDLVIWYCSTDGGGLQLWEGGTSPTGNSDVISYVATGKPLWVIGTDVLYQVYGTSSSSIPSGDFAHDALGLSSYDVQSYANDGSTGCPEVDRISTAPSIFPATIKWIFPTAWYIDGCTPLATTIPIYQMGPSSYTLSGSKSMFHHKEFGRSVMSTLFDPSLIDSFANRTNFLQKSITYLLGASVGVGNQEIARYANLYPNPVHTSFTVKFSSVRTMDADLQLYDAFGRNVHSRKVQLEAGENTLTTSIADLPPGVYSVRVSAADGASIYAGSLSKL